MSTGGQDRHMEPGAAHRRPWFLRARVGAQASYVLGAFGIALLVLAAILLVQRTAEPAPVGDLDAITASLSPTATTVGDAAVMDPPRDRTDDDPLRPAFTARTMPPIESRPPPPVRLTIAALGIDAPIVEAGVEQDGQMEVPDNVSDVAWYGFGPRPGEPGSAVLAAHVDLAGQGPGVFFELGRLAPDDRIAVTLADGHRIWFRVVARATYDKAELPLDTVFSREGAPVLTLVTCGGGFDRSSRRYDSNVVVFAVPIDTDPLDAR